MRRILAPTIALGLAIAGWWALVTLLGIDPFLLPGPEDVVVAFGEHWRYLLEQTAITLVHTMAGFTVAGVAAIVLAGLLAASGLLREALLPLLVAIQAVPKVAVAPLLLIWLGFGSSSKIMLVLLLSFFPILIATLAGLTSTPAELIEYSSSLSASRWSTFTRIRVRWALPQMFTGLKVAISLALIGAVVAQIFLPNAGLGMVIVRSNQASNTALALAAVALLALIGIGLFYLLVLAERLLLPWARHTTG